MAQTSLTSYFNTNFPLPQAASWTEFQLPKNVVSLVTSCLRGELSPMALLLRPQGIEANTGTIGAGTLPSLDATPSYLMRLHLTETKSSAAMPQESAQERLAEETNSKFKRSLTQSRPSTRPYSWLDNELRSTGRTKSTT